MSIGLWRAPLKLSAKPLVNSLYSVRTPHVKHVVVVLSILLLPLVSLAGEPQPGTLISAHQFAKPEKFADWEFAKKVWWEMDTRQAFDAEWNKYAADFEAWLVDYRANPYKAQKALKEYPAEKRQRILRGHDMQMAYDDWWNHMYAAWYDDYERKVRNGRAYPFPELLKKRMASGCNGTQNWISDCGGPDWRTEAMKAKDQVMMAKVADAVAKEQASRKAKTQR